MKRLIALLLTIVLCLSMGACGKSASNLKDAIKKDTIDYSDALTDTVISYKKKVYRFNNKYNDFTINMVNSFENYEIQPNKTYAETENQFEISFWSFYVGNIVVSVNDADQIKVADDMEEPKYYISSGIYNKIKEQLDPVIKKTSKYYSLEQDKMVQTSTFKIYDKKGNLMEDNLADRNPHIFQLDDKVVALWIQQGSSASTRSNTFFNWETGDISSEFFGYTDTYGSYVCCGGKNKITITDMFTDKVYYTVDKFSKELSDLEDSITSVRFDNDGKQIKVQYIDVNYEMVDETIDIPAGVLK